jgi:hypothetical protein
MSTITQICTQIKTLLDTLPAIDQSSLDGFLPPVRTQKVALVIPPMGMRGNVGAPVGRKTRLVHRIPCEFWVKVDTGDLAACMQRGREICLDAAAELQASLTLGGAVTYLGEGEGSVPFDWAVEDQVLQVNNVAFIRATLFVTVTEWVVLQA